jgi:hypothetical protein
VVKSENLIRDIRFSLANFPELTTRLAELFSLLISNFSNSNLPPAFAQSQHQEIIFPGPLVNIIGKISMKRQGRWN